MKFLVGAACVAIIAATSFWGWQQFEASRAKSRETAEARQAERAAVEAMNLEIMARCRDMVLQWDRGLKGYVEAHYGKDPEWRVENCRQLLAARQSEPRP